MISPGRSERSTSSVRVFLRWSSELHRRSSRARAVEPSAWPLVRLSPPPRLRAPRVIFQIQRPSTLLHRWSSRLGAPGHLLGRWRTFVHRPVSEPGVGELSDPTSGHCSASPVLGARHAEQIVTNAEQFARAMVNICPSLELLSPTSVTICSDVGAVCSVAGARSSARRAKSVARRAQRPKRLNGIGLAGPSDAVFRPEGARSSAPSARGFGQAGKQAQVVAGTEMNLTPFCGA